MNRLDFETDIWGRIEKRSHTIARPAWCGGAICYDENGNRFRSKNGKRMWFKDEHSRTWFDGVPCTNDPVPDQATCLACRELERVQEIADKARISRTVGKEHGSKYTRDRV